MIDIERAFAQFGFRLRRLELWGPPFPGPLLADWVADQPRQALRRYPHALLIEDPTKRDMHWAAVWGPCILNSLSAGKWVPLASSTHRARFVAVVFRVEPPAWRTGPMASGPVAW
jgi:hypothetical protein